MEQKTTHVFLRTVIEFADNNGYRLVGVCVKCDSHCLMDRDGIKEILEERPDLFVWCKIVGCGIDYHQTKSIDGRYEFSLIS